MERTKLKKCGKCKKEKDVSFFYKDKGRKGGYSYCCKECHGKYDKQKYKKNKSHYCEMSKQRQINHPERNKRYRLKHAYNFTPEQYDVMFNIQQGCCIICGANQNEFKKALNIDHNHKTGEVRGLLCTHCNRMLGGARDNIIVLKNGISYLEKYK